MDRTELDLNRYSDPPEGWATSLANNAEVIVPCLDAIGARSVAEVGAYAGDLTELLVDWAALSGARVVAVDPSPQEALVALAAQREQLELVRRTSLEALPEMELTDAIVIDGDHNYWTVGEELRLIGERGAGSRPAAAVLPRRLLAPRPPRRLLRCRADPGRPSPPAGG